MEPSLLFYSMGHYHRLPSFHENYQQEPCYGVGHLAYLEKDLELPPCKVVHHHPETSHIILFKWTQPFHYQKSKEEDL